MPEPTKEIADEIRELIRAKGWNQIEVIEYPGDYSIVSVLNTTSSRISHPQSSFFKTPELLSRLSHSSASGLEVISHYNAEMTEMSQQASGIKYFCLGESDCYVFPSGREIRTKNFL